MELIRPDTRIDFIGKRKIALVISTIVILISLGSIFLHGGLKYGVDFAGGILLQIKFSKAVDISEVRNALEAIGVEGCNGSEFWRGERVFNPYRKKP
jgi:preprotein translocase subunit SecF